MKPSPRNFDIARAAAGSTLIAFALTLAMTDQTSSAAPLPNIYSITDTPRPPASSTPAPIDTSVPPPTTTPRPQTNTRAPDTVISLDGDELCSPQNGLVRYSVRLHNSGNSSAYNVRITNVLGDNAQLESVDLQQGVLRQGDAANISFFDVAVIDPGQEIVATVTLRLTDAPGSSIDVLAHVDTTTPGDQMLNNIQALHCSLTIDAPAPAATPFFMLPTTGGDLSRP